MVQKKRNQSFIEQITEDKIGFIRRVKTIIFLSISLIVFSCNNTLKQDTQSEKMLIVPSPIDSAISILFSGLYYEDSLVTLWDSVFIMYKGKKEYVDCHNYKVTPLQKDYWSPDGRVFGWYYLDNKTSIPDNIQFNKLISNVGRKKTYLNLILNGIRLDIYHKCTAIFVDEYCSPPLIDDNLLQNYSFVKDKPCAVTTMHMNSDNDEGYFFLLTDIINNDITFCNNSKKDDIVKYFSTEDRIYAYISMLRVLHDKNEPFDSYVYTQIISLINVLTKSGDIEDAKRLKNYFLKEENRNILPSAGVF